MSLLEQALTETKYQVAILILGLLAYLLSPSQVKPAVGLAVGAYLVVSFLYESFSNAKSRGWKEEAKDLGITLLGILLLFTALRFALNTETPISAVVSCSMVPEINRGDLIIVQGAESYSAGGSVEGRVAALFSPRTEVFFRGESIGEVDGSMFSYCTLRRGSEVCNAFYSNPTQFFEKRGDFKFFYDACTRGGKEEPCIVSIVIGNERFGVREGEILVYAPQKGTLFAQYGDIIHRAVLEIKDGGKTYYLTKGDNNNILDIQFYNGLYNTPPEKAQVRGKVLFKIPLLGYYKIFITPYLSEDAACNNPLTYSGS